uniref:Protein max n=1 Tax=Monopterus albus TaxID=43700 RepID=A0A3Q3K1J8_MONAL
MSENDDIEVDSDVCRFADKRAHHNALERKRRDHIKDSFHSLRDSVPSLQGEKASRAQILDKATEYIQFMRRKNHSHQQDIDDLKKQNALLEQQGKWRGVIVVGDFLQHNVWFRALEKAKGNTQLQTNCSSDSSFSESEPDEPPNRKKLRVEPS